MLERTDDALILTIIDKSILDKLNIEKTEIGCSGVEKIGYIKKGELRLLYEQIGRILHSDISIHVK